VKLKRPSVPTVIALLALFVALGGPAQAQRFINGKLRKGSVTSRTIKDRSVQVRDLNRRAVRSLQSTPNNSVNEAKLANGSVTPGKLAGGAVGSAAIADAGVTGADLAPSSVGTAAVVDGSITGTKVADGTLGGRHIARFSGRFRVQIPEIAGDTCWSAAPDGLAPELAGADISQDLVLVTPGADWPDKELSFSVSNDGDVSQFVLEACNPGGAAHPAFEVGFRYVVIDIP
jgi:hypothetical protein